MSGTEQLLKKTLNIYDKSVVDIIVDYKYILEHRERIQKINEHIKELVFSNHRASFLPYKPDINVTICNTFRPFNQNKKKRIYGICITICGWCGEIVGKYKDFCKCGIPRKAMEEVNTYIHNYNRDNGVYD